MPSLTLEGEIVEDPLIPPGFKVVHYPLSKILPSIFNKRVVGWYGWYEVFSPKGSEGHFLSIHDAIQAAINYAKPDNDPPPVDEFQAGWRDLRPIQKNCIRCLRTRNRDGSEVAWRCHICKGRVCTACTKTIGCDEDTSKDWGMGFEYHAETYCSTKCWEADGRPSR